MANLGLIFFMFFLGLELDLDQIKRNWKITIPVATASIIIPGKYLNIYIYRILSIQNRRLKTFSLVNIFSGHRLCSISMAL